MKVHIYVKELSDICSLWNIKFYDYESYNILREEDYKENSFLFVKMFLVKDKVTNYLI